MSGVKLLMGAVAIRIPHGIAKAPSCRVATSVLQLGVSVYSRLQQVGIQAWDDLGWFSFFLGFGVGGQSSSNFLASTVWSSTGKNTDRIELLKCMGQNEGLPKASL